MDSSFRNVNVNRNLMFKHKPLFDADGKIDPAFLPNNVTKVYKNHGSFHRRDITLGPITLEVTEGGEFVKLIVGEEEFESETSTGMDVVGPKHSPIPGFKYSLTCDENAILEVQETNRKYILTKRKHQL